MAAISFHRHGSDILYTGTTGIISFGDFHSTAANYGLKISVSRTKAVAVYVDDGGAALTPSGSVPDLRGGISRFLITASQSAVHARVWGFMGQAKIYNTLFNEEQIGGLNGRMEVVQSGAGTTTLAGYGVTSGVCGILATAGTVLVNTNHVAAAVAAIADIKGTVTQTGVVAGVYVGKYDTSQWSDSTSRAAFTYGVYVAASSATTGICVSTCTTGISLTGTQTTGISIGSSVTTSIAVVTPATFTGVPAANGIIYANTTATSTTPGSVRAILGSATLAATTTSGTIVGVRGVVTGTTAITGTVYAYGVQGKIVLDSVNVTAGTAHVCGVMAQISGSSLTATSGHIAGLIVSGQNLPASSNVNMIYCESGGNSVNSILQANVKSDYVFDISDFESSAAVVTPAGSTPSGTLRALKCLIDGQAVYILAAATYS